MIVQGRAWKYGDDLCATDIVSADYDKLGMSHDWDGCAKHVLENVDPEFLQKLVPGDIIVAGSRLGTGHAHYYTSAIMACKYAGIAALFCESVNALFQRAAIDQGYPIWQLPGIGDFVNDGDRLRIDLASGEAQNETTGESRRFQPVPQLVRDILAAGNALDWALARVA
ncbi:MULTISPECIES: hypothetical protein [unclassified Sphingobium]|uniref:hypothetical protein n=1 Tax=unclassified Sphingobium TaxID=2611147 RepID=UPI0035A5EC21